MKRSRRSRSSTPSRRRRSGARRTGARTRRTSRSTTATAATRTSLSANPRSSWSPQPEGETRRRRSSARRHGPGPGGRPLQARLAEAVRNTVFNEAQLRRLYEVEAGGEDWYTTARSSRATSGAQPLPGRGYIYAYTNQVTTPRTGRRRHRRHGADLRGRPLQARSARVRRQQQDAGEGAAARVPPRRGRLDGHGTFRRSVFKVNQLGYSSSRGSARVPPSTTPTGWSTSRSRATNRPHRHPVRAGYSELDKFFAQFMFNTATSSAGRGARRRGVDRHARRQLLGVVLRAVLPRPPHGRRRLALRHTQDLETYEREGATVGGVGRERRHLRSVLGVIRPGDVFSRYVTARRSSPARAADPAAAAAAAAVQRHADAGAVLRRVLRRHLVADPGLLHDSRDDPFEPTRGTMYFGRLRWPAAARRRLPLPAPEVGLVTSPLTRRYIVALTPKPATSGPSRSPRSVLRPLPPRRRALAARFGVYEVVPRTELGRYFLTESGAISARPLCPAQLEFQSRSAARCASSCSPTWATPTTRPGVGLQPDALLGGRRTAHLPADLPGAAALHLRRQPRSVPTRNPPTSSSRSAPLSDKLTAHS